ncbi:hypothetical protein EVAR_103979_1 [Eumeta japonica]|uniref:Uncharacterized protein n=1 Tax=Eumeta variegata TaxID=151549 RepID=A0A4C1Y0C6_EUMVA|nr:hypothetical protein EVAR_103979_1 [Eumeta japonica]
MKSSFEPRSEVSAPHVYECAWCCIVFTVRRQPSYVRSSRVFTPVYCSVSMPSARRLLRLGYALAESRFQYRSLLVISYTLKRFVVDYVRATAFVDQQQSLSGEDKRSIVDGQRSNSVIGVQSN